MLLDELGRLLPGVASGRLSVLGFQGQLDEFAPQTFHLLLDDRPGIVSLDDRPQALGGADGLQAGHAGADDEDAGRAHRAGGRHEQGEETRKVIGGQQDRFVTGHRAHGAENVHCLSACDARHQFHGESGDLAPGQGLDLGQGGVRLQKTYRQGAFLHGADLINGRRLHFEHDVADRKNIGFQAHAFILIGCIRITGLLPCARLQEHLQPRLLQLADQIGHQRHPPLSLRCLPGNADNHDTPLGSWS